MKIAVSGAHRVGKSSLIEELASSLPGYRTLDEPYHLLEEEGHELAEEPSIEDFELQLERSIECMSLRDPDILFDRCPADLLAYLLTHDDAGALDAEEWLPRARDAIELLDLVVFVPVEDRDRIPLPSSEDAGWRARVDAKIRDILLENPWELAIDVLEVTGTVRDRAQQVLAHLRATRG